MYTKYSHTKCKGGGTHQTGDVVFDPGERVVVVVHGAKVLLAAADAQRHEVLVLGLRQKCINCILNLCQLSVSLRGARHSEEAFGRNFQPDGYSLE